MNYSAIIGFLTFIVAVRLLLLRQSNFAITFISFARLSCFPKNIRTVIGKTASGFMKPVDRLHFLEAG